MISSPVLTGNEIELFKCLGGKVMTFMTFTLLKLTAEWSACLYSYRPADVRISLNMWSWSFQSLVYWWSSRGPSSRLSCVFVLQWAQYAAVTQGDTRTAVNTARPSSAQTRRPRSRRSTLSKSTARASVRSSSAVWPTTPNPTQSEALSTVSTTNVANHAWLHPNSHTMVGTRWSALVCKITISLCWT